MGARPAGYSYVLPPEIASLLRTAAMRLDHLLQAHAYATSAERLPLKRAQQRIRSEGLHVDGTLVREPKHQVVPGVEAVTDACGAVLENALMIGLGICRGGDGRLQVWHGDGTTHSGRRVGDREAECVPISKMNVPIVGSGQSELHGRGHYLIRTEGARVRKVLRRGSLWYGAEGRGSF